MKDYSKVWDKVQKAVQKSETISCSEPSYTRVSSSVIKRKK